MGFKISVHDFNAIDTGQTKMSWFEQLVFIKMCSANKLSSK